MAGATNDERDGFTDPKGPPYYGLPTSSPYTVEGGIEREVALFAGARRVGGWRKYVVYSIFAFFGLATLAGLIGGVVSLFLN